MKKIKRQDKDSPQLKTQRMVICTWIAELMLSKITTIRTKNANNNVKIINPGNKNEKPKPPTQDELKAEANALQLYKEELRILKMGFREFVRENKADLDTDTIF